MGTQLSSFSKRARFEDLGDTVQQCTLCPRLCGRTKVLSDANGDLESTVLFVAEAPGRLGAEVTGVPLRGTGPGSTSRPYWRSLDGHAETSSSRTHCSATRRTNVAKTIHPQRRKWRTAHRTSI